MEPEVHIIEKYFQEIKLCFTMMNIQRALDASKRREILANKAA
jgi:hypothetical protein